MFALVEQADLGGFHLARQLTHTGLQRHAGPGPVLREIALHGLEPTDAPEVEDPGAVRQPGAHGFGQRSDAGQLFRIRC